MRNYEVIDDDEYGEELLEDDYEGWLADYWHEELMIREED